MLKLWGSLLVITAGSLCGLSVSRMYTRRLLLHRKLLRLYNETAILLEYSMPTFAEIVSYLSQSGEFAEFGFLNCACDELAIRQAVLNAIDSWDVSLEESSLANLRCFFEKLGTTDIGGQISYAQLAAAQESEIIASLSGKYRQKAGMFRTFGTLGGVLAAILMI